MGVVRLAERCWFLVRDASRLLRAHAGFTAIAVTSLALGIGVNTAIFSVVYAVLLAPLPYPQQDRLVAVGRLGAVVGSVGDVTMREFDFFAAQSRSLSPFAGYQGTGDRRLTWNSEHDWRSTLSVTREFLRALQVRPALGREFSADEMNVDGPPAAIVSDAVWRTLLRADRAAIGQTIRINDAPYTLVGVLPREFWFDGPFDVLLPLKSDGSQSARGTNTSIIARLRDGLTMTQAHAEISTLSAALRRAPDAELPADYLGLAAIPYRDVVAGSLRQNLLLLFGATGLLLLLACANLFTLLLTRFAAREREVALRIALGGTHAAITAGFFVEQCLIALLGAAGGLITGSALLRLFAAWMPWKLPTPRPLQLDPVVFAFTLGVAVVAALALTIVPVLILRHVNLASSLQSGARGTGAGRVTARTRHALVVLEVAISTMLMIGAGLVIQSLYRMQQERLGFETVGLTTFETPLAPERRPAPQRIQFTDTMMDGLRRIPGVERVAAISLLPLTGRGNTPVQRDGHPEQSIGGMEIRAVTPGYFAAMGIPIRQGRDITERDSNSSLPVVLINEAVAREWWPNGGAIGDRVLVGRFRGKQFSNDPAREVVAIVADTKTVTLQQPPRPTIFIPVTQGMPTGTLTWILRSAPSSAANRDLAADLRHVVTRLDAQQRIQRVRTMEAVVEQTMVAPRFNASLFGIFAGTALLLAVIGIYGVIAFLVNRRAQEIGTRMALGAEPIDVLKIFMRQGLWLTLTGLAIGLVGAYFMSRALAALLFGVKPADPASFAGVSLLLLLVGLLATLIPAWRATRIDPVLTLRRE
jgi:putative ABC transport system permease protein